MRKKERYEKVIAWFQDNIPVAETELHYNNPYELLIAVILSAQCTDKRVNIITPPSVSYTHLNHTRYRKSYRSGTYPKDQRERE